jgi:ABC-type polysaccharide/polyol phosphate export permease
LASPTPSVVRSSKSSSPIRELLGARELLRNLTVRELKVRYKRSSLGFLWTLLNPLLMMAVFTVVFTYVFVPGSIDWFPIYFLSGYLAFSFFQASVQVGTGSIIGNGNLVKKVYFPRSVLPLSVVLSQAVHLALGLGVLLVAETVIFRWDQRFTWWWYLPSLLFAVVLLAAFTTGITLLLSAANTYFRDIQEFMTVGFLLWFYATPIIYDPSVFPATIQTLIKLNPLYWYVALFRSALYEMRLPGLPTVLICLGWAAVSLAVGWLVFDKLAAQFAKEV